MFGLRRLVSQILFLDDHFSELMIKSSYPPDFTGCSQTSGFREDIRFTPLSGAYSAHSEIAAGGIASFHLRNHILRFRFQLRLCGSLTPTESGIVPSNFRSWSTRSFDGELALSPLSSAVWTFLPD